MAALQFICFLVLVVGCLSLCSYYNARIEELENKVIELEKRGKKDAELE